MRENQLLSPWRQHEPARATYTRGRSLPKRQIRCGAPTLPQLSRKRWAVTIFAAIDHCTAECIGIHVVKKANRFEALEPIRQASRSTWIVLSRQRPQVSDYATITGVST